jgi:hypothetical protein
MRVMSSGAREGFWRVDCFYCSLHDKKPRLIRRLISRAERSDLPQGLTRPARQKKVNQTDFLSACRSWPCSPCSRRLGRCALFCKGRAACPSRPDSGLFSWRFPVFRFFAPPARSRFFGARAGLWHSRLFFSWPCTKGRLPTAHGFL